MWTHARFCRIVSCRLMWVDPHSQFWRHRHLIRGDTPYRQGQFYFTLICNRVVVPAHLAPRGRHSVVQQSHVWHSDWVQLLPVHVEAHVEWYSHQQTGEQHYEDTETYGPQRNLQASLVADHSNAVASQHQVLEVDWRPRQQLFLYPTRRARPFCRKESVAWVMLTPRLIQDIHQFYGRRSGGVRVRVTHTVSSYLHSCT
jgi:hypothetical protein